MPQLVIANHPLFDYPEVSIRTLANDRALVEVLSLARSTMIRAFLADNVSILMTFFAIQIVTAMVRGAADLDLLLTVLDNTSSFDVDIVLVVTKRASPSHRRGFHLVCRCFCCSYTKAALSDVSYMLSM
jgi:hypothetical protein